MDDSYTVGGSLEINAVFGAVNENSLPTYVPAVTGDNPVDAYFQDVDVTDDAGAAKAITAGGLVNVTPVKPYGVAEVQVTVTKASTDTSSYTVPELIGMLGGNVSLTYSISINTPAPTPSGTNYARVYKAAPTTGGSGYATQALSVTLTFNKATKSWALSGTGYTLEQPASATGTGTIKFYYSVKNASSDSSTAETTDSHTNDKIATDIA